MRSLKRIINRFALWLADITSEHNNEPEVRTAVKQAFADVGLPLEQFNDNFDLVRASKLTDVYHLSARYLKTEPELNTVSDVVRWLKN